MEYELKRPENISSSRNLVFTSAGDNSNISKWGNGDKNFDLWICYYGDRDGQLHDLADYYVNHKGGKFPNLKFVYDNWKDEIDKYDAILVMDDDIIISTTKINQLFNIQKKHDLSLLQPAFSIKGKISHNITRMRPFSYLRYSNFVEVTCPLIKKPILDKFMKTYNPQLVGWGIDYWLSSSIENNDKKRIAIIDSVSCINPHDKNKGGIREINSLEPMHVRRDKWLKIKHNLNISLDKKTIELYEEINKPYNLYQSILEYLRQTKSHFRNIHTTRNLLN